MASEHRIPPADDIPDPVDFLLEYFKTRTDQNLAFLRQMQNLAGDETLTADQLRERLSEAVKTHAKDELAVMLEVAAQTGATLTKLDAANN